MNEIEKLMYQHDFASYKKMQIELERLSAINAELLAALELSMKVLQIATQMIPSARIEIAITKVREAIYKAKDTRED